MKNLSPNPRSVNVQSKGDSPIAQIVIFLLLSYKKILIFSLAGFIAAIIYLIVTPNQFEAVAQIQMAKNISNNVVGNGPPVISETYVEEPLLLINRLTSPTSFTAGSIDECSAYGSSSPLEAIKLSLVKGLPGLVELRVRAASPGQAAKCAQNIFELIATTQKAMISPFIREAIDKKNSNERRIVKLQAEISRADQPGQSMTATYLSGRDEIRYLLEELTFLDKFIAVSQISQTRLISPIFASDSPVTPNKRKVILYGIVGGLLMGMLWAWLSETLKDLRKFLGT